MTTHSVRADGAHRTQLAGAASLFRGLADPTRLAIVRRLARGEARVVDLTAELGSAPSTVSAHTLPACGIVGCWMAGRRAMFLWSRSACRR
jgi:ArsR family transcriptional regulator, cadmium/lead-responsive transcriptional repressor